MSRPRRLAYLFATLGLLLVCLPQLLGLSPLARGISLELKTAGVILNGPGMMLLGSTLGYTAARTLLGRIASWLLTLLMLEPLLRWIEKPQRCQSPSATAAQQVTRRSFLLASSGLAGAGVLGGYGYFYERRNLQLEQYLLTMPDLPAELEGVRLVLMADWHCGPFNRPGDLLPAIRLANRCRPDLILLPGDFISISGRYFSEAAELAAQLTPSIHGGVLVSWGNHDYWHGLTPGLEQMPQAGCQILTNRSLLLNSRRELSDSGESGLWLCGLDDLWAGKPNLTGTLSGLPQHQPRLVLSHNPDLAEEQWGSRIDLMVSGHTHGGQVRIPTLGTPVLPSRYGQKYASGFVQAPHYPVYVTRGVGVGGIPIRFGVPPEVTLFQLQRGPRRALSRTRLV